MQLVTMRTEQLEGTIEMKRDERVEFVVSFPERGDKA